MLFLLCLFGVFLYKNICRKSLGELCFKVPYKFVGYLNNKQATDDMIDDEGISYSSLHTF